MHREEGMSRSKGRTRTTNVLERRRGAITDAVEAVPTAEAAVGIVTRITDAVEAVPTAEAAAMT